MFWRIIKKSFLKGAREKLLAIITIAFGASLASAMLTVSIDVGDKVNKELKTYGANLILEPITETIPVEIGSGNLELLKENEYIKEENLQKMKMIFWANNIVGFTPYLEVSGKLKNTNQDISLVGTWFNKHLDIETGESLDTGVKSLKSWWEIKGSWVDDKTSTNEVMVGSGIASKYKLRLNDKLSFNAVTKEGIKEVDLNIVGIIDGGPEAEGKIYAPIKLVQSILNLPGKVAKVEVSALTTPENELAVKAEKDKASLTAEEFERWYCTAYVSAIAYQIEEAISGVEARPVRKVANSEGLILQKIQLLMLILTFAALISSALGISSLMTTKVLERSKEIGLMKAIGAENWQVNLIFLTEATITGFIGGLVGYGIGLLFAQVIGKSVFGTGLSFNAMIIPIVIILSIGIALAGSYSAARMITRLRPAEVLHGGR